MLVSILGSSWTDSTESSLINSRKWASPPVRGKAEKGTGRCPWVDMIICIVVLGMDGAFMVFTVFVKINKINEKESHTWSNVDNVL